jgi:hypothetical protein
MAGRPRSKWRLITRPVLSRKPVIMSWLLRVNRILPPPTVKKSRPNSWAAALHLTSQWNRVMLFPWRDYLNDQ